MTTDLFALVADRLEHHTDFDRLEARGTLRIALKMAGVDAKDFTFDELEAVFAKIMPDELEQRGLANADAVCGIVMKSLAGAVSDTADASVVSRDEIVRRLGSA